MWPLHHRRSNRLSYYPDRSSYTAQHSTGHRNRFRYRRTGLRQNTLADFLCCATLLVGLSNEPELKEIWEIRRPQIVSLPQCLEFFRNLRSWLLFDIKKKYHIYFVKKRIRIRTFILTFMFFPNWNFILIILYLIRTKNTKPRYFKNNKPRYMKNSKLSLGQK